MQENPVTGDQTQIIGSQTKTYCSMITIEGAATVFL